MSVYQIFRVFGVTVILAFASLNCWALDPALREMGFDDSLRSVEFSGVPADPTEAARWYLKLAAQGNAGAQNNLALKYAKGDGVPKNPAAVLRLLRSAADQHLAVAELNLGLIYGGENEYGITSKDEAESARWIRKAAENGDASAQFFLAMFHSSGTYSFPQDAVVAKQWLAKAVDQNLPVAQLFLGLERMRDGSSENDKVVGVKYIRMAADAGVGFAQIALAECYKKGEGVPRDDREAVKLIKDAAASGSALGQLALADIYEKGEGVVRDEALAFRYYLLAAKQSMKLSYAPVGRAYALGRGVPLDNNQAIYWLKKCDDKAWQFQRLAEQYATGDQVRKDGTKAIEWYQVLAEEGFDHGLEKIGQLYLEGNCVRRDYGQALEWFLKAARKGTASAQNSVGELYARGLGVAKDEIEALAWFYLAVAEDDSLAIRNRNALEQQLGRDAALAAQQRSKELAKNLSGRNEMGGATRSGDAALVQAPELLKSSGSGAIISSRGHVLTAAHVVANGGKITVLTARGMQAATVERLDQANDLAVLKLAEGAYASLPVVSSRQVRLGQTVATIGFPNIEIQGFSPKVTRGEISSLNGIGDDPRAWQISVPVQPGNSGGALLDEFGNVVGVVVSKLGLKAVKATGDIPQNVNYAVKSTYALALIEPYLSSKAVEPTQTGIKPRFEDMIAKAQQCVVLILVY